MTRLLVVDDDAHIRELLRLYLADEGFDVIEAVDGMEAWNYITNHSIDMVIMDIMMPRLDGWELCRNQGGRQYADSHDYCQRRIGRENKRISAGYR